MALHSKPLQSVLDTVDEASQGKDTNIKAVLEAFGDRAFGPILTFCGVLLLTPLGAIPGVPFAIFVVLSSFALQIILGRQHPWVPNVLARLKLKHEQLEKTKSTMRPWLSRIDGLLRPRWRWATQPPAQQYSAILTLLLAASLLPLGTIPFASMLPGTIIILLGLGTTARDGVITIIGMSMGTACLALLIASLI